MIKIQCVLCVERTGVLILGGGMAGVMAAHTMKSAGMNDFLLIEAAGRLGGRVSTTTFCGTRAAIGTLCFAIEEAVKH